MERQFQYISCYGLSINGYQGHYYFTCFNTSHVTVYLFHQTEVIDGKTVSIHLMLRFIAVECFDEDCDLTFQYISCYGLSKKLWNGYQMQTSFNTSHVTVYLFCMVSYGTVYGSFNTSHVTVYHVIGYTITF